jgi:hypothetical protein
MKKTTLKLITKKTAKTTWKVYRKGHNIAMDYSSKLLNKLKF